MQVNFKISPQSLSEFSIWPLSSWEKRKLLPLSQASNLYLGYICLFICLSLQILSPSLFRNVSFFSLFKSFQPFTHSPFRLAWRASVRLCTHIRFHLTLFLFVVSQFHTLQTHIPLSIDGPLSPGNSSSFFSNQRALVPHSQLVCSNNVLTVCVLISVCLIQYACVSNKTCVLM